MNLQVSASCVPSGLPSTLSGLPSTDPILPGIIQWPPNPIASMYPGDVTGLANGTIVVLPIPFEEARAIIPSQYGILNDSYASLLPGFPADKYPVVVRSIFSDSIGAAGLELLADFQQVQIRFPFVDLLGDGYSAFSYQMVELINSQAIVAFFGASGYGSDLYPTTFVPENQAYQYVNSSDPEDGTFLLAYTNTSDCPTVVNKFQPQSDLGPWPLEFYTNFTNMPFFGDPENGCGQQVTFFNTSFSEGEYAPQGIYGGIYITESFLPRTTFAPGVHGAAVTYAWLEYNYLNCSTLKGL